MGNGTIWEKKNKAFVLLEDFCLVRALILSLKSSFRDLMESRLPVFSQLRIHCKRSFNGKGTCVLWISSQGCGRDRLRSC